MTFILSQILIVLAYIFLGGTYLLKDKKLIILLSSLAAFCYGLAYAFVFAWTGVVMNLIALIRNILFIIVGVKFKNSSKSRRIVLICVYVLIIASSVFTYDGVLSLMAVFATVLYSTALWIDKDRYYKILGSLTSVLWIIYNVFIKLYLSVVFESIMVICAGIGYMKSIKELKKEMKDGKNMFG